MNKNLKMVRLFSLISVQGGSKCNLSDFSPLSAGPHNWLSYPRMLYKVGPFEGWILIHLKKDFFSAEELFLKYICVSHFYYTICYI